MMQAIIGLAFALVSVGVGFSQTFEAPSTQEAVAATLGNLQGIGETFNTPKIEHLRILWHLITYDSALQPPVTSSGPIVSVRRLRHRVPKSANKAFERAGKLARANDAGRAAMELENAIALDQKFAEAHAELGVQYALLGRYQEAEAELRRTIELIPDDSIPYSNLAWVELRLGKVAEVEQSLRQIIRRSPENATAYMMLGSLLSGAPETLAEGTRYLEYAARTIPDAKLILKKLDGKVAVLTYPVLP